ncbi:MAG TPA: DNA topoisomerase IB [Acidimicrobiia bacterium]|nr:DNA topoisomerase IB [Acidimicrobiia bacterium]
MTIEDSMSLAAHAGLHYVAEETPGLRRIRRGRGFSYVGPDGGTVNGEVRKRIELLVIPPAWEGVWISPDSSGHILATGYDSAGRKQYIYHPLWEQVRDEAKFERMGEFGRRLARLRRRMDSDLRRPGLSREKVTALAVSVLDRTLIRVGNRKYADENEAYGLTTLTCDHVEVDGFHVHLEFAGKGGADHQLVFRDRRLASLIARCQELSGQTLFGYETGQGVSPITSTDVNGYLSEVMSGPFTAKDFRTWGASTAVAEDLATGPDNEDAEVRLLRAIDATAEKLGNTREVCRSSYLHPIIPEAFRAGSLQKTWARSRRGLWLGRAESAVNRLVAERVGSNGSV